MQEKRAPVARVHLFDFHSFSCHVLPPFSDRVSSLDLAASPILAFKHRGHRQVSAAAGSGSSEGEEDEGGGGSGGRERANGKDAHQHAVQSKLMHSQAKAAPHWGQVLLVVVLEVEKEEAV